MMNGIGFKWGIDRKLGTAEQQFCNYLDGLIAMDIWSFRRKDAAHAIKCTLATIGCVMGNLKKSEVFVYRYDRDDNLTYIISFDNPYAAEGAQA